MIWTILLELLAWIGIVALGGILLCTILCVVVATVLLVKAAIKVFRESEGGDEDGR